MTPRDAPPAAAPPRLHAHTERVPGAPDLLDHLGPGGAAWLVPAAGGVTGFVTSGVAAEVAPEDAVALLRTVEHERPPGAPYTAAPRAIGALPFAGPGRLVVPERLVTRTADGATWRTEIERDRHRPAEPVRPAPGSGRGIRSIIEITDRVGWRSAVAEILGLVAAGGAEKVVLAREVVVEAWEAFDLPTVLRALVASQPGCVVYADRGFAGASPELLVRRTGGDVCCRPMAGTGRDATALSRSEKDAREHRLVVDAVVAGLAPACDAITASGPDPVVLADVIHLATTITARLRDLDVSAVDLACALHPPPAVAGTPRAAALDAIRRLEPTPRGRYAGPCGWVDADGDGEFVVALRGARLDGPRASLHAGARIVAGSDPDAEWAETQAKLEPMLRALAAADRGCCDDD